MSLLHGSLVLKRGRGGGAGEIRGGARGGEGGGGGVKIRVGQRGENREGRKGKDERGRGRQKREKTKDNIQGKQKEEKTKHTRYAAC